MDTEQTSKQPEFTDEKALPASEKRLILRALKQFLAHGYQPEHFTDRLYQHLSLHCSFIAHTNRGGFYAYYFEVPGRTTRLFLDQFDPAQPGISAEYGDDGWLNASTGADLNRAMRDAAGTHMAKLRLQFSNAEMQRDLTMAARLAAKWGKRVVDAVEDSDPESPAVAKPAADAQKEQMRMSWEG